MPACGTNSRVSLFVVAGIGVGTIASTVPVRMVHLHIELRKVWAAIAAPMPEMPTEGPGEASGRHINDPDSVGTRIGNR